MNFSCEMYEAEIFSGRVAQATRRRFAIASAIPIDFMGMFFQKYFIFLIQKYLILTGVLLFFYKYRSMFLIRPASETEAFAQRLKQALQGRGVRTSPTIVANEFNWRSWGAASRLKRYAIDDFASPCQRKASCAGSDAYLTVPAAALSTCGLMRSLTQRSRSSHIWRISASVGVSKALGSSMVTTGTPLCTPA